MAISDSRDNLESYDAAALIERALKHMGTFDANETIDSDEQADALEQLNLILKELTGQGADVFLRKTAYLFPISPGTANSYTTGTSGTVTLTSGYYLTTLASAAGASANPITVTDDTNMSDTDVILIELDDGTLQKTTISGAPSTNSVTLSTATTGAAAEGNLVYSWPTANSVSDKIVEILHASRRLTDTDEASSNGGSMLGYDSPMEIIGEQDYRNMAQKFITGVPTHVHLRQNYLNNEIFLWPTGGVGKYHALPLTYRTYISDADATTDTFEIPQEGLNAICWMLAAELSGDYGLTEREITRLWTIAEKKKNDFLDSVIESGPIQLTADQRVR